MHSRDGVTPARLHIRRQRRNPAVRALYRGAAVVLITFAVLPFTAPFSTCGLSALLAAPMAIDGREHAAATTIAAADPGQVVSSSNETFQDHVLVPDVTHAPTVDAVSDPARAQVSRTAFASFVPLVLRL